MGRNGCLKEKVERNMKVLQLIITREGKKWESRNLSIVYSLSVKNSEKSYKVDFIVWNFPIFSV